MSEADNNRSGLVEGGEGKSEKRRSSSKSGGGNLYLLCENALDKLVLLDYQSTFCKIHETVPFPRNYFAEPANNSR